MEIDAEFALGVMMFLFGGVLAMFGPRVGGSYHAVRALNAERAFGVAASGVGIVLSIMGLALLGKVLSPVIASIDGKIVKRGYTRPSGKKTNPPPRYFLEIQEADGNVLRLNVDAETYNRLHDGQAVTKAAMSQEIQAKAP